ncbi:hypothetical protein BDF22DRAFT_745905 [Syncephalis plumigaleata]|nr:hypothetical protein BDF22DRAFT_745905 [Syncephalis plumigaleata]
MNISRSPSPSNSLGELLAADYIEIDALLEHYEEVTGSPHVSEGYYRHRQQCINELVRLSSIHWYIDEAVLLAALEGVMDGDQISLVRRWLNEARANLAILSDMEIDDAGYHATMEKVRRDLSLGRHKETEWLNMLKDSRDAIGMAELADRAMSARAFAPTRPHPNLPDCSTTAGKIASTVMASMDRIRDYGREFDRPAHRQSPVPRID